MKKTQRFPILLQSGPLAQQCVCVRARMFFFSFLHGVSIATKNYRHENLETQKFPVLGSIAQQYSFCSFSIMAMMVENTFTGIPSMAQLMFPGVSLFPHFCFKNKVQEVNVRRFISLYFTLVS